MNPRIIYLDYLESSVEDPGHLKHQDVIERIRIIVFHGVDHELGELHVHVLQASSPIINNAIFSS